MVHHLTRTRLAAAVALAAALAACGGGRPARIAGPRLAIPAGGEIPTLSEPQFGGGGGATALGGEQLAQVQAAAPPGLHVTKIQISVLSKAARDALHISQYRVYSGGPGLITLPAAGVDPQLGMYYLVVPVVNEGPEPVRNLKARADFIDAKGIVVWSEEQAVTHFPTRLGLNPPSLPNTPKAPAGELGLQTKGFGLYYFAFNVGVFTFAVPDAEVAKTVKDWRLTFLVSQT
jgi:hypothetical protein